jgi:ABC-type polysaccharide/polyol phosphate export permease
MLFNVHKRSLHSLFMITPIKSQGGKVTKSSPNVVEERKLLNNIESKKPSFALANTIKRKITNTIEMIVILIQCCLMFINVANEGLDQYEKNELETSHHQYLSKGA